MPNVSIRSDKYCPSSWQQYNIDYQTTFISETMKHFATKM